MARARTPLDQRILTAHRREGECWIWTGAVGRDGYGVMTVGRRQMRAHRASYQAFNGDPVGKLVCHKCDRPLCVNPAHLFLGMPCDNTRDMIAKGRAAPVRTDDAHHATKISHGQREAIRKARAEGATLAALAERYGVVFQTISAICRGESSYGAA